MKLFTKQQLIRNGMVSAERKRICGSFSEHGHDFFEIEYIINGSGSYIIDGIVYKIHPNMIFFMSPVSFHAIENADAEIINVMFPCDLCDPAILFQLISHNMKTLTFSEDDNILAQKLLLEVVIGSQENHAAYAIQFLRCFLYKLAALTPQSNTQPSSHIQSTIIYILENFRSGITLQSTADHVGLVPAYLSALFLQETGVNFKAYVDNLRFDYAAGLLTSTEMSVLEICVQSGFCDYANFTRRFKQKYGEPPRAYRLKHQTSSRTL